MGAGLYIMRHGEPMPLQDEPVHRFLQLTGSESKALESRGVRAKGDLVGHTQSAATWRIFPALPGLKPNLRLKPPVFSAMIQRGLCWRCPVKVFPFNPKEFADIPGWVRNGPK